MLSEFKTAHSTISWALGCSREEARKLCKEVQSLQGGEVSSHSKIAGAILMLEHEGRHYTKQKIAKTAEQMPLRSREKMAEKIAEDPAVWRFEGTLAHQDFLDWIDRNAHQGFVLNVQGNQGRPVFHTARCSHLRPDPEKDKKITRHPKLCSTSRKELRKKATNYANRLELCSQCEV